MTLKTKKNMKEATRRKIDELLANPDLLIKKKPFTRGVRELDMSH